MAEVSIEDPQQAEQRRAELRRSIDKLKQSLEQDFNLKGKLSQQLRAIDQKVNNSANRVQQINRRIKQATTKLSGLEKRNQQLKSEIGLNRDLLGQYLRASYQIGQQEYFKLILNQQNPSSVARTLSYYQFFKNARLQRITDLQQKMEQIRKIEHDKLQEQQQLETSKQQQLSNMQQLRQQSREQQQLIARVNRDIRSKDDKIRLLLENQKQLGNLLGRLHKELETLGTPIPARPFAKQKGKLLWPTSGRISARYGSRRQPGNLRWQGVLIRSENGAAVASVADGTVVFADWLRGFGLLIIIDHSDGYMSLYGHNQSLGKTLGDKVHAGDTIAWVGQSGGQQQSSLYFEIRRNGKPQNPARWCRQFPG